MLGRLQETGTATEVQETSFSIDVLGRYVCNTWDEAIHNGGAPFDVVVIGAGMFGAYAAEKIYRRGAAQGLRVLVLEAGPFLVSEHVQNLARIGLNAAGPVATDPGVPRERVWGLPWRSNIPFVGLAYAIGGRSLYWGGWAPRMTDADLANWPAELAQYLKREYEDVEDEIGSGTTTDYIHGALQKELKRKFETAATNTPTVDKVEDAPLAVQGKPPRSGLFSFDKYSSAPILIDAVREASHKPDHERRLFIVPRVHVTRIETNGAFATGISVVASGQPKHLPLAPHASVVIATGTIESTRLALDSFPTALMGRNLVGHLRSNFTARIRRSAFDNIAKDVETAAMLVRGSTPQGRYHIQVTAVGSDGTNSEEQMWRMIPDIDLVRQLEHKNPDWIVMTLRGIGEMIGNKGPNSSDRSWMDLSPYEYDEFGKRRAYVQIKATSDENKLWSAMYDASLALVQHIAGTSPGTIEYLVNGQWAPVPPTDAQTRDKLGTTHHEAGTLWMGSDPNASVTTLDGRFHHVANCYVSGPALFPTLGSANPTLTGLTLARRTARAITSQAAPVVEAGFASLLTPSLDGWQMAGRGYFSAHANLVEAHGGTGLLWYKKQEYADFVLKLEYRQASWWDNSGVFLRIPALGSSDPDNDWRPAATHGYEVQIDERGFNPDTNSERNADHATGALYKLAPATKNASRPIGSWNELEIEARGDKITVKLNGETVSQLTQAKRNPKGYVGLQSHHDGSRVQFRNMRIKAL